MAIADFERACEHLKAMGTGAEGQQLGRSVRRLEAIRADLETRIRHGTQDALFVGLNVAQAGLSSVTDALGEMREAYSMMQPHDEPPRGTYREEEEEEDEDAIVDLAPHDRLAAAPKLRDPPPS